MIPGLRGPVPWGSLHAPGPPFPILTPTRRATGTHRDPGQDRGLVSVTQDTSQDILSWRQAGRRCEQERAKSRQSRRAERGRSPLRPAGGPHHRPAALPITGLSEEGGGSLEHCPPSSLGPGQSRAEPKGQVGLASGVKVGKNPGAPASLAGLARVQAAVR